MQNKLAVTMQIYWADPRKQLWALAQIPKKEKPIFIGTSLSSWNNREGALNIYLFYRVLLLIYLILKQFPCRGTTLPSSLQIPAILFFLFSHILYPDSSFLSSFSPRPILRPLPWRKKRIPPNHWFLISNRIRILLLSQITLEMKANM